MIAGLKKRAWVILAAAGAVAAVIGIAQAAIPDQGGVIHGCYGSTGLLRVIDAPTETCRSNETALNWAQAGPPGPVGPTGPVGGGTNSAATSSSGGLKDLPLETAVTLRAGTYLVWGIAEYYGDESSSGFNSQCSFWRDFVGFDAGGTHIPAIGDSAIFSGKDDEHGQVTIMATATLPTDGSIFLHCSADNDAQAVLRLFTLKVDGIN
jgi:hypothetical protein